ncbi:U2 small nuclear ribonucleoprotein B [Angomonas deanei]|uniref:RNA recognition motif. (A.k.a. RRM, RBD, or RNP domain), putative n=1 Tax=Angomonas deanei TaxID=59799 RepID=S9VG18_9TRYP|nr:U2 small nuclear ribonucleoprotein B [Angomonas deanei]EPY39813.1 U2 small nuclear ribonucleoprotein B [Angomonas deanei]CAD2213352.1 RNA recognition motif. (a.k.a. RRM, RBD, or RNP domain), putative [Angomonas deanei]|eukprot:EPY39560.1 U2 small nuclear ribonucleoprotein B [Angomonas deanei]
MEEPKQVLYVRGLPDKVSANEVRRALYLYCTQFGPVAQVLYKNSEKMYGQAFIVFTDVATATAAREVLNGRSFYGKKIQAFYAKRKSFCVDPSEKRRRNATALKRQRDS